MEQFNLHIPIRAVFGAGELNNLHKQVMPGRKALLVISNGRSIRTNVYLHVVRGGGWFDVGKHLRSAYRSVLPLSYRADNIGFRVARNIGNGQMGQTVPSICKLVPNADIRMPLSVTYGGSNTRTVAQKIQKVTGGKLFEIHLEKEYPTEYRQVVERFRNEKSTKKWLALKGDRAETADASVSRWLQKLGFQ